MRPGFFITTLMNLEACHICQARGAVGVLGEWNIICEACGGNGKLFRERAALMQEEEWETGQERQEEPPPADGG